MLIQLQNSRIKVIYFQGFLWQIELEFSLNSQFQIHFSQGLTFAPKLPVIFAIYNNSS